MEFNLPWYFYVLFGIFLGLLIGNAKFRHEFDAILARIMGSKKGKGKGKEKEEGNAKGSRQDDNNNGDGCSLCGYVGRMAIVFDNNKAICQQCLEEITGAQLSRPSRRRGTHIREMFFDD